jgi:hypothetical protein
MYTYQNECSYCGRLLHTGFICPECKATLYQTELTEVYLHNIDETIVAGIMETLGFGTE